MQKLSKKNKKAMVFGVFDRIHRGHHSFLQQARLYAKELIVVVARDQAVIRLKKKKPKENEGIRCSKIQQVAGVTHAMLGDKVQGIYGVVKKYKPDVLCLGYDQKALIKDLRHKMLQGVIPNIRIIRLKPYEAVKFHSSLF